MEFYKHQSLWSLLKKVQWRGLFNSQGEFFEHYIQTAENNGDAFAFRRAVMEEAWEKLERPYYNMFPVVLPMLMSLRLDIPCSTLKDISIHPIEVRLPIELKDSTLNWEDGRIKSLLFGLQPVPTEVGSEQLTTGLTIAFDIGEVDSEGHPILSFKFFPLRDDLTIEEAAMLLPNHPSFNRGIVVPQNVLMSVVKLCACVALIDGNSDMITPDIINKDKGKWENASAEEREIIIQRSRARGKTGWNIGAEIEYAPHYRRPHPALVRIGKGRKLTRIVMRKGSLVHREKLISIPTGYSAEES